jgi:DNA helicase HerA-like ATPase
MADFTADMKAGYGFDDRAVGIGRPYVDPASPETGVEVRVPIAMLNRHGLIAGATGTGKTKTLQLLAEQLAAAGTPVFAADMKGDLSGIGAPADPDDRIDARVRDLGCDWAPAAAAVELFSLTGADGVPLRATVASFGPTLLAKVLGLNETQEAALWLVFRFCDEKGLPLVELEDLRAVLAYLTGPGKPELARLGGVSTATAGVLLRKLTVLEGEGAGDLFGEPELDVRDLLRTAPGGRGVVSVLGLADVADRPALFSTFLMWVLAELHEALPEAGDLPQPKLVFFLDEAHLLFDDATEGFLDAVEQTVRLIRSKGVGVVFITQLPTDLPDDVLAQLGNRIQHAVRAFTAKDARALRSVAETYPETEHYDLRETLQSLGVGEALVTVLDPRGVPTPVAATRLYPPASRMAPLTPEERTAIVAASPLRDRYADAFDRESAYEMLAARAAGDAARVEEVRTAAKKRPPRPRDEPPAPRDDAGLTGQVADLLRSPTAQKVGREVARGLFGMLRKRL